MRILICRRKMKTVHVTYNIFLFLGLAILFRLLVPPTVINESENFDMMVTFGSNGFKPNQNDILMDTDQILGIEEFYLQDSLLEDDDTGKVSVADVCL